MNSRRRFEETMGYGRPDRVPYFEEGIREEVLQQWHHQGMPSHVALAELFPVDGRVEIALEVGPLPYPKKWPTGSSELGEFRRRLDPEDPDRWPADWLDHLPDRNKHDDVVMLRVHRGLFQTMGIGDWSRFEQVLYLLKDDPAFVHEAMELQGYFAARLAERVLQEVEIDAAIFGEPIGGNEGPLISPQMYEEFVLTSYEPVLEILRRHQVETLILRTYANARILIPSMLKWGFNCLWACEVNIDTMDYRDLRREFGRDLRLIGGIDVDVLRHGKEAIRREVEEKVPSLLESGGYVPLVDGRVRPDVPFEHYAYYRRLLERIIS